MVYQFAFFHIKLQLISAISEFVTTDGKERPTCKTAIPLTAGDEHGRGSIVLFNQAFMYAASETGFGIIGFAKLAGQTGWLDYNMTAQEAFECYLYGLPISP
jgi:hypothetical protein